MAQQTVQKQSRKTETNTAETEVKPKDLKEECKRITNKADELVEKIDEILGDNTEEIDQFVKNFKQQGGE